VTSEPARVVNSPSLSPYAFARVGAWSAPGPHANGPVPIS
jgi:hypothetical protein